MSNKNVDALESWRNTCIFHARAEEPTRIEAYYHTIMFGVPCGPVMILPYAGFPDWINCWNLVELLSIKGRDLEIRTDYIHRDNQSPDKSGGSNERCK